MKDFSRRSVHGRNTVLPPQALALGTLNRLVFSLISRYCCISSRNTLWFKKSSVHLRQNLKNLLLSSKKPYIIYGSQRCELPHICHMNNICGIFFPSLRNLVFVRLLRLAGREILLSWEKGWAIGSVNKGHIRVWLYIFVKIQMPEAVGYFLWRRSYWSSNVRLMPCRVLRCAGIWSLKADYWCGRYFDVPSDSLTVDVWISSRETSAIPEREVETKGAQCRFLNWVIFLLT